MRSYSVRFDSKLIRLLPLLVAIPYVLLSPLAGQSLHLHDHDRQGLHAHVHAEFTHEAEYSDWGTIHYDAHRHSDTKSSGWQENYGCVTDLTTDVLIRVLPTIIAAPPGGIRAAQNCSAPGAAAPISPLPAVPIRLVHSPDFFDFAPDTRADNALALILRTNNAIRI